VEDLPQIVKDRLAMPTDSNGNPMSIQGLLYLLITPTSVIDLETLTQHLSQILAGGKLKTPIIWTIPVPLLAPTSKEQGAQWSTSHWPTIYKKNNPFGPHPQIVATAESEIKDNVATWMGMAHEAGFAAKKLGMGERSGAVIVHRGSGKPAVAVAMAGDARWLNGHDDGIGNVMAHSALRAIGMVAQKLRLAEAANSGASPTILGTLESDVFNDVPLTPREHETFRDLNIPPEGYLCHNLEIYLTHEPCVMCSMALLHSRFGRVVFGKRVPKTGGLSSDTSAYAHPGEDGVEEGLGHGLFWRKELNWSFLAWQDEGVTGGKAEMEEDFRDDIHY
jgi:tRNA-specific adenosine deaminase 3